MWVKFIGWIAIYSADKKLSILWTTGARCLNRSAAKKVRVYYQAFLYHPHFNFSYQETKPQIQSRTLSILLKFLIQPIDIQTQHDPLKHQPLALFLFLIGLNGNTRSISISISISTTWLLFRVYCWLPGKLSHRLAPWNLKSFPSINVSNKIC